MLRIFRRALLVASAGGLVYGEPSSAAVLRVPSEFGTIQEAVDAAAVGDTVLVAPGTYTDIVIRVVGGISQSACVFLRGGVSLVSEGGPESTTIDMQQAQGIPFPHVLHGIVFAPQEMVVNGFTILGVRWGNTGVIAYGGGKAVFSHCILRDLDAGPTVVGGIGVDETDLDLVECVFERCKGGGAGAVYVDQADVYASGCTFVECEVTAMQLMAEYPNTFHATIEDCSFSRNRDPGGHGGGLSIVQYGGGCALRRCRFEDNDARDSGAGADIGVHGSVLVEDCVFWNNRSLQSWGGALLVAGNGTVRGCTFSANAGVFEGSAVILGVGPFEFLNNVVANTSGGPALGGSGTQLTGGCNVFWNNAGGDAQNYTFAPTDRIVDPLFCGEATGDLTLQAQSPCLPAFSLGCGLIGALEQGCGAVSVETDSWGKIKAAYR